MLANAIKDGWGKAQLHTQVRARLDTAEGELKPIQGS